MDVGAWMGTCIHFLPVYRSVGAHKIRMQTLKRKRKQYEVSWMRMKIRSRRVLVNHVHYVHFPRCYALSVVDHLVHSIATCRLRPQQLLVVLFCLLGAFPPGPTPLGSRDSHFTICTRFYLAHRFMIVGM